MKTAVRLFALILTVGTCFTGSGCLKKPVIDQPDVYPKSITFTYKVTSTTVNGVDIITCKTGTGADSVITTVGLPFSQLFRARVNKNDVLSLGYGTHSNQNVKLEILVDNVPVKSQVFNSTSGAIVYLFE